MLKPETIPLHLGLEKPVRVLHLTDPHLALADDTDGDSMKRHARGRRAVFLGESLADDTGRLGRNLEEAMAYGRDFDATVLTGDVIDFVTHANLEEAKRILSPYDYLFCAGNHEYCQRVGIPGSFAYRDQCMKTVQSAFKGNMLFDSRVVGGVNLITADNAFYVWSAEQLEQLKEQTARGYPCLLFCHVPLSSPALNHTSATEELETDEETIALTRAVTDFIVQSPAIRAVFAGHEHVSSVQMLPGGKPCYILGGLFRGTVGEITID